MENIHNIENKNLKVKFQIISTNMVWGRMEVNVCKGLTYLAYKSGGDGQGFCLLLFPGQEVYI